MTGSIEIDGQLYVIGEIVSGERVADWLSEGILSAPRDGGSYIRVAEGLYLLPLPGGEGEGEFLLRDERRI